MLYFYHLIKAFVVIFTYGCINNNVILSYFPVTPRQINPTSSKTNKSQTEHLFCSTQLCLSFFHVYLRLLNKTINLDNLSFYVWNGSILSQTPRNKKSAIQPCCFTALFTKFVLAYNYFLRSRYSPVEVSTLIISPCLMNAGTFTTNPVSIVASFITDEVVSPLTTSSVYVTSKYKFFGNSTLITLPSKKCGVRRPRPGAAGPVPGRRAAPAVSLKPIRITACKRLYKRGLAMVYMTGCSYYYIFH